MDRYEKYANGSSGLGDGYSGRDEAEVELDYLVHHSEPGDLNLLGSLLERYTAEVYRLSSALLTLSVIPRIDESVILYLVERTFAYAVRHTDRFRGWVSLRSWLFSIAIRQSAQLERELRKRLTDLPENDTPEQSLSGLWERFDNLPGKQQLVLLLRYLCNQSVDELAETLAVRQKNAHAWLVKGRRSLLQDRLPSHRAEDLDDYLDGLITDDLDKRDELESHLPSCKECDEYLIQIRQVDNQLRFELQERWKLPTFEPQQIEDLTRAVQDHIPARRSWWLPALPLKQVAWIGGLLVFFTLSFFIFINQQSSEAEFPQKATRTPTPLVLIDPVQVPEYIRANHQSPTTSSVFKPITFAMSKDGGQIVLQQSMYGIEGQDMPLAAQELLWYDQVKKTKFLVSSSQENPQTSNWYGSLPGLSADGRFLVFSQTGSPEGEPESTCTTGPGSSCPDIYVFDRQTGSFEQITIGMNGEPANGSSLAPIISADGRWVVFWSMASNLVAGDAKPCFIDTTNCLDIYLYDRQEKTYVRIPVGASLSLEFINPDRLSITADGALVAFTVHADDLLGKQLDIPQASQALIFHREDKTYRIINMNPDGDYGNGASSSPMLSPDGRYVAFASQASNLVPGNYDGFFDVYLLDRQTDQVERISVTSAGVEGDGDSGTLFEKVGYYGIDLSADGRYVVFLSAAKNLGGPRACSGSNEQPCNAIFLHDRLSGTTEVIAPKKNDSFYIYLNISNDGRWISYNEIPLICEYNLDQCFRVNLYDRQRRWLSNLNDILLPPSKAEWKASAPIQALPEQVNVLAASPDGRYLAAAFINSSVGLWDFSARQWVKTFQVDTVSSITSLAFDPTNEWLALGTMDGMVNIWRLSGTSIYELKDHPGRVHTLIFSPDGEFLYAGTPTELWAWQRMDRRIVRAYKLEYPTAVNEFALSPNGNLLASASTDQSVWLQLLPSGALISRLGGQDNIVVSVAFSADGKLLASRAPSGDVNLWHVDWQGFGALETDFPSAITGLNWFGNLQFSPDNKFLASGSYYEGIMLWDMQAEQLINLYDSGADQGIVRSLAFTPDGSTIIAGGFGDLSVWQRHRRVLEPRFFSRVEDQAEVSLEANTPPDVDWQNVLQPIGDSGTHLDLYKVDEILPFDLRVPTRLPEQAHFTEAEILTNGGAALYYLVDISSEIKAKMIVVEQPVASIGHGMIVGENAQVEEVSVNGAYAEYVSGDWRTQPADINSAQDQSTWIWDAEAPVLRLTWYDYVESLMITIYYIEGEIGSPGEAKLNLGSDVSSGGSSPDLSLDQEELTQIAAGMEPLLMDGQTEPVYTTYKILEGDTCYGIAAVVGTSVESLILLNPALGDCSLIRTGEGIIVPVKNERQTVAQLDLDCDGSDERLQVIPALTPTDTQFVLHFFLQISTDMGLFRDVWQISVSSGEIDQLSAPTLIEFGECQNFFSLQVTLNNIVEFQLYRWENDKLVQVFKTAGFFVSSDELRNTITVQTGITDPGTGICELWQITYLWDGESFSEFERVLDPSGLRCR